MYHIPDPPADSVVRLRATEEGGVVWWEAYSHERRMALLAAVGVGVFGVGGGIALLVSSILSQVSPWQTVAAVGVIALSALTVALCARLVVQLTESLTVSDGEIVYGKPAPPRVVWRLFGWDDQTQTLNAGLALDRFVIRAIGDWKKMWPRRELVKLTRADVTDVRIEGRGRFGHVTISVGRSDLDFGKALSNADRAWVLEVLEQWLGRSSGGNHSPREATVYRHARSRGNHVDFPTTGTRVRCGPATALKGPIRYGQKPAAELA